MILNPVLITAGVFAGVGLTMTSLYYLLSRFRPAIHQLPPSPPQPQGPKSTAAADLKEVLSIIPVIYHSNNEGFSDCSVCLSSFEEGEKVRFLPDCGHGYHAVCIDKWLCTQLSCPFCRSPVSTPAKSLVAEPEAGESSTASRTLLSIKMAFWRNRTPRDSSTGDEGSNGGGTPGHEREESSPV
ncbi:hypothetical protein KFK09_029154 [Dendrobium nobile]|uniref:RING-type domain-containing protein n=1 Tax=Dendrobium nobile TaxID=94219 RepID=A0A8T3A567_DENNO|nr:hypothetical protein KFK09_029154 [Dendrobium nobile]